MDSFALRHLIHYVGDSHNALHSVEMFSEKLYNGKLKNGDNGGNLISLDDNYSK